MKTILGLALLLSLSSATWGQKSATLWDSGNDFLRLCEAPKGEYEVACGYWLVGVQHGMQLEDQFRPEHKSLPSEVAAAKAQVDQLNKLGIKPSAIFPAGNLCLPDSVTNAQIRLVVVKYMKDHPTQLNTHAGLLVIAALKDAWGCQ